MFEHESDIVESLLANNDEFKALYDKHHELKSRVQDAELGTRPMNHDSLGTLKKEKLLAKDQMAEMIAEYRRLHS